MAVTAMLTENKLFCQSLTYTMSDYCKTFQICLTICIGMANALNKVVFIVLHSFKSTNYQQIKRAILGHKLSKMIVNLRSYFKESFLQYDEQISCLKFGDSHNHDDETKGQTQSVTRSRGFVRILFSQMIAHSLLLENDE